MSNENETDVFPGPVADATNESGMSIDDALGSAYDDWDRGENGIAEGERENLGKHLKFHADSAGTTVINGLDSLISPAVTLRHGSQDEKRALLGFVVDEYQIQDVPMAQSQPVEYGAPALGADGQEIATDAEAMSEISRFIDANPIAQDERIQENIVFIVNDMRRQGFQPNLAQAFEIAVANDTRYSPAARQAQQDADVARAKAASVQVSGSGSTSPNQAGDDLADIIDEAVPNW